MHPNRQYRVVEYDGDFQIQVLTITMHKKHWWSRKATVVKEEWMTVDFRGRPCYPDGMLFTIIANPDYKTLEEARAKIASWEKGLIVHQAHD